MSVRARLSGSKLNLQFPSLGDSLLYKTFLHNFFQIAENEKALAAGLEKDEVDKGYEKQLTDSRYCKLDDGSIRKYLAETRTREAYSEWKSLTSELLKHHQINAVSGQVQSLKLPTIGRNPGNSTGKGKKKDNWDRQTYADFAEKVVNRNAEVALDKALVDDAFRYALSLATRSSPTKQASADNPAVLEKMLKRCLGKESEEYWKRRGES